MAAGFASAFHAPMAGALLASEIVYRGLALEVGALAPALIGALAGFTVYGLFHGYGPLLELPPGPLEWPQLLFGLAIGLVCAGVGTLWLGPSGSYNGGCAGLPLGFDMRCLAWCWLGSCC